MSNANRETPKDWGWAYHATTEELLPRIAKEGLKPHLHEHLEDYPVIFVEPDLEGVAPYIGEGGVVLRFKTPGFGSTPDGEDVIIGGSQSVNTEPDAPLVGGPGEDGVIPPERLQILRNRKFEWLIP